ncbi:hypothetical protein FA13DRAFT_1711653 [Coprinellus micaceus]|uniref:Uncharacterized protein n=1 Tax=Coprinellus micaceus TaxID=71717 RepID=A0A4Y7T396_COPMI|nr:hypothetical protein FA13DRAFT_1711653 [Coprinellus micaceus]
MPTSFPEHVRAARASELLGSSEGKASIPLGSCAALGCPGMPWDRHALAALAALGCSGVLRGTHRPARNNYKNNYNKGGWCLGIRGLVAGVRWQGRASDRDDVAEMVESGLVAGMRWQRQWAGGGLVAGVVAGVEVEVEVEVEVVG